MKNVIGSAVLLLALPTVLRAADADNSVQGQFYVFIAPMVSFQYAEYGESAFGNNTGFGGEVLIHKGAGVGIELGYAADNWSFNGTGSALGVGSADFTYHFLGDKSGRKTEGFVTGGYSLYYGERTTTQSGYNLGVGVNLWLTKHVAPRLELRYQGGIDGFHGFSQFGEFLAFRVGVTFR
jgi:opacity protein-like surface antigen